MPPGETTDWIALNMLPGMGSILTRRALERWHHPAEIAYRLPHGALAEMRGFQTTAGELREARRGLARLAREELKRCHGLGIRLLVRGAPDYPAALEEISDAPILLYASGRLFPGVVRVAIVGSRRPTSYGIGRARILAGNLARAGIEIVSGGARGIDTLAHVEALEAGGRTVAVLGSGLARPYPRENEKLFRRIADRGAVLTEFPLDLGPKPGHFPRRNRLISGLSAAVLVVEANERSGSLITAGHAAEQGREVLAVPGPVTSERSAGCHRLIRQGAKLVSDAEDVIEELPSMYAEALVRKPEAPNVGPPAQAVLRLDSPDEVTVAGLLDRPDAVHLDELADLAPFGIARLQLALLGLQVQGAIELLPGRYYRRSDR